MKRSIGWVATLCAVLVPAAALAGADGSTPEDDHKAPLGERTRAYLDRQRSGDEASEGHGLTPPAERRARKRYLKSFEHPIPDLFDTKETKEK